MKLMDKIAAIPMSIEPSACPIKPYLNPSIR
jgi:hypothetical protein